MLSVIIPASNEAEYIEDCLQALLSQHWPTDGAPGVEVIVAANACTDATVEISESYRNEFDRKGWDLVILDIAEGGKLNALNKAEDVARGRVCAYLDADVTLSDGVLYQLYVALNVPAARYASGTLRIAPSNNWVTRHYARIWIRLPFMKSDVPGAGLFAVNNAGRARWGEFPNIISDDGFVRLQFAPEERLIVPATYQWPLVEGFSNLARVRGRQDAGVRELEARFPEIMRNEGKQPMRPTDHLTLLMTAPVSYLVYVSVRLAAAFAFSKGGSAWVRGR
jgi:glycosyltransferase involved in cell wall biosynthesis